MRACCRRRRRRVSLSFADFNNRKYFGLNAHNKVQTPKYTFRKLSLSSQANINEVHPEAYVYVQVHLGAACI